MDASAMKKVLLGVSAVSFSALLALKYQRRAAAAAAAATTAAASSASASASSSSASNTAAAAVAVAAAPAAAPAAAKPSLTPAASGEAAPPLTTAPSLLRADSQAELNGSNPATPTGVDPIVKQMVREQAKHMPRPLVVCGPSGVGKGTLVGMILKEFPDHFGKSISHTTRKPRKGEVDGVHYHFVTLEDMHKGIADHKFVENAVYAANHYGTSVAAVQAVAQTGKICILEIDIQGAEKIHRQAQLKPHFMFILPPDMPTLVERLRLRGTETQEAIDLRLKTANEELAKLEKHKYFEHKILNNSLEQAYGGFREALFKCYPHLKDHSDAATAAFEALKRRTGEDTPTHQQRLLRESLEHVERLKAKAKAATAAAAAAGAAAPAAASAAASSATPSVGAAPAAAAASAAAN